MINLCELNPTFEVFQKLLSKNPGFADLLKQDIRHAQREDLTAMFDSFRMNYCHSTINPHIEFNDSTYQNIIGSVRDFIHQSESFSFNLSKDTITQAFYTAGLVDAWDRIEPCVYCNKKTYSQALRIRIENNIVRLQAAISSEVRIYFEVIASDEALYKYFTAWLEEHSLTRWQVNPETYEIQQVINYGN